MEIRDVASTDLFAGSEERPLQIVRAVLVNQGPGMVAAGGSIRVRADGAGVTTPEPLLVSGLEAGARTTVEIPVEVASGASEGERRDIVVTAEAGETAVHAPGELLVAAPGWRMYMVSHFHYDPVWWNTQAGFTATWDDLPAAVRDRRPPEVRTAFELVRAHLDAARHDPDYKFVLAELDYLKPYWDVYPEDRADLRDLITAGRIELVGGMYNEPNTNLTSLESTIRNTVYGVGYQRDVVGGDPRTGWMLDVFGHDPAYPSVMADAGITSNSWARGPFHQWGPHLTVGDNARMQFPSEFEWIAPDGRGLLTGYMPNHYGAGWALQKLPTLEDAAEKAYEIFCDLRKVAVTRNTLLPVGADHVLPSRWAAEIHRTWNKRYVWPRFVMGLPQEFFGAVREEAARRHIAFSPQSRDMNPVYTGKDVSYIDTKQGQRAAENALIDAEKFATLATVLGARYPGEAIDKGWRQLCFNAHHDGITGTESDQVYLDMLGGWREAYELGARARDEAIEHLGGHVDTRGEGRPLLVVNPASWPRTDVATVTASFPAPGPGGVEVRDSEEGAVAAVCEQALRHPDGTLAEIRLRFVATDVPATGYRTYRLAECPSDGVPGWETDEGTRIENAALLVEADPARGGALSRVYDKRAGKDLLRAGEVGGELVIHDEYPDHPDFREGPWHLVPKGTREGTSSVPACVRVETSPAGRKLVSTTRLGELTFTQEVTLWDGLHRVDMRTRVDGSIGQDRLLRARFPFAVEGARPVYEVGNAAIGRTFGFPDVDAAEHPWTLDNPAYTWAGLSSTARVWLRHEDGMQSLHAIGVAEIVAESGTPRLRDLVATLARQGVTATTSAPEGPRYGALDVDSNLPDVRVSVGGPEENAFTRAVLASADEAYATWLAEQLAGTGQARVWVPPARTRADTWVPSADLRGDRVLPVLIVAGSNAHDTAAALADLASDLGDATVHVDVPSGLGGTTEPLEDYSVALLNRGTPSAVAEHDGTLHLSLMRACSGWPSGVWIDPPRRTTPDGANFQYQHWSHTFEYALVCGPGDWRDAGFVHAGQGYNHPFESRAVDAHEGELPPAASLLEVEPSDVVLTALKPAGNPLAAQREDTRDGRVTVRCYESRGRAAQARVRCFVPLDDAMLTNVLEQPGKPLGTTDREILVNLDPGQTVTATAVPECQAGEETMPAATAEPAQPVYTRYWLHNKGPAPLGNQPVSVYVEPQIVDLDEPASVRITASAAIPGEKRTAGDVALLLPDGVHVDGTDRMSYDLAGEDYARFDVTLRADANANAGTYHLAARITDPSGETLEDVATLRLGETPRAADGLELHLDTRELTLPPGDAGEVRVRIANRCGDEVRGEAQLISPYGTWNLLAPWSRGFVVQGGGETALDYRMRVPAGTDPMRTWALVKVMAFGQVYYSDAVSLTVRRPAQE